MHPDTLAFLDVLYGRCNSLRSSACLTFTAIHPTEKYPAPSRHILLSDRAALLNTLRRLSDTNVMGWGAYVAVGLRKPGLTRWKRGGLSEVAALPAFYTDIDGLADATLIRLREARLPPSVIVNSGGGLHAYWLLEEPTTDLQTARQVLHGLAQTFGGDHLSTAQSLRLPGTVNTKPERTGTRCHLIDLSDRRYSLSDFQIFAQLGSHSRGWQTTEQTVSQISNRNLNTELIQAITAALYREYAARERRRSDWIAALCPCGHARDSPGTHFSFNPTIGCGRCHGRHGTLRLTDLCSILGIDAAAYGGIYR
ncbi:MAG: RepB family DNA primase [Chloroflexi bacterium]|nr:RepB family DNA primase [Chloroflexota bacterium]